MSDLNSLVRAVTVEAFTVASKTGILPEQIEIEGTFDLGASGHLMINGSSRSTGPCRIRVKMAPAARPLTDFA